MIGLGSFSRGPGAGSPARTGGPPPAGAAGPSGRLDRVAPGAPPPRVVVAPPPGAAVRARWSPGPSQPEDLRRDARRHAWRVLRSVATAWVRARFERCARRVGRLAVERQRPKFPHVAAKTQPLRER